MPRLAWILLLSLSLLWGGSFLAARIAAPVISPLTLVFLRCLIAALTLHVFLVFSGHRMPVDRQSMVDYAVMGLANNVIPFALIFYGTQTIGAGPASILNATTPIFTALVVHVFTTDEKLTVNKMAGVILGFVGVTVMLGLEAVSAMGNHVAAEAACLLAAVSYAFSTLWARRFRGRPPIQTATGQLTMSTLLVLPLALIFEQPLAMAWPTTDVVLSVLFLAIFATALAYILFFRILTLAGSNVMLVTFLVPVSAVLLGAVVLSEHLEPRHWIGMFLIMSGLAAIDGRLAKKFLKART